MLGCDGRVVKGRLSQLLCGCQLCEHDVYGVGGVAGTEELLKPAVAHSHSPHQIEALDQRQQLLRGRGPPYLCMLVAGVVTCVCSIALPQVQGP